MSILDFFGRSDVALRVENSTLKRRIKKLERILSANKGLIRRQAEDRDALLAQNCRLRAERDLAIESRRRARRYDALAHRRRDEQGRFR